MSIASEITRINNNISAAYTKVSDKGGTLPATQNSANLATAIDSISTGGGANITSLSVTPSTSQQVITASGNVDGYSPITVSAVTSSIDANITAGNIKDGVSILGVTGTYTGSGGVVVDHRIVENGVYKSPSQSYTYTCPSAVTGMGEQAFYYSFYQDTNLTSVSFPSLQTVNGSNAFYYCFASCTNLTSASFPSLQTINGERAFYDSFFRCTNLTSVSFHSLQTISGSQAFYYCFNGCSSLQTISFPKLTSITSSDALQNCFYNCGNITAIHFRQDAQSTIEATTGYSSRWGATMATIYFDLTD